ncbi:MAG: hypothetical protein WDN75_08175 [Bacteroidota bacterium]
MLRPGVDPRELEKKMKSVVEKYMLPLWIQQGAVNAKELVGMISFSFSR